MMRHMRTRWIGLPLLALAALLMAADNPSAMPDWPDWRGPNRDGKKLWERSITEEFSPFTTHGGRTVSPIVDGNLVIVSTPTSTWGSMAQRQQRFIALDKRTGDIIWISTPGGRPYDTSYSAMN